MSAHLTHLIEWDPRRHDVEIETARSYPFLRMAGEHAAVAVFYYVVLGPGTRPRRIYMPGWLALAAPETDSVIEFRRIRPEDFSIDMLDPGKDEPIGITGALKLADFEELDREEAALFSAFDTLLAAWPAVAAVSGQSKASAVSDHDQGKAAAAYIRGLRKLVEPPLLPYYFFLSEDFFLWATQLAGVDLIDPPGTDQEAPEEAIRRWMDADEFH